MASILLVEDEARIAASIQRGLRAEQHVVDVRYDGTTGLAAARAGSFDLLVLDWMLPGLPGPELCGILRREGHTLPILMLTARDTT
ncbi:MAG: response regulator, partial [Alphaproteobacteria bacterium]|nr:response regulator [Alphaproteobacteria bacterium]